jgi:glycosyltransferase involved in cell wall biosynthesis
MSSVNAGAGLVGRKHKIPVVSHQRELEYAGLPNRAVVRSGIFSHHITSSKAITRALLNLGLPESRCSMIYDPVPPLPGRASRNGANGRPLTVAMYSMLMPWKGQEDFLHAIGEVSQRVQIPFRTVIGGCEPFGDTGYLKRLEGLTRELNLQSKVSFTGFTPHVYERLQETDILVLASVDPEPGGHIVQEAMMSGVPVVTTDGGGPSEYMQDSEAGIVVPRRDPHAMAAAIEKMLIDATLRSDLAVKAQRYARNAFDPSTIAAQIMAVYEKCLT